MADNKKGRNGGDRATPNASTDRQNTPPMVTGQCAQVLALIRLHPPVPSFILTADHAIPEAADDLGGQY